MTRELKFRAWTNHNGWSDDMMVTQTLEKDEVGYLCMNCQKVVYMSDRYKEQNGEIVEVSQWEECINTIVMQFTGLLDENGTEIYEGDILECKSEFTFEGKQACTYSYHQIVFNDNFAVFNTLMVAQKDMKGKIYKPDNKEPNHYSFIDVCKTMQIIGNIYQNPELINAKPN